MYLYLQSHEFKKYLVIRLLYNLKYIFEHETLVKQKSEV